MPITDTYKLRYFSRGQLYLASTDFRRFTIIDNNIASIMSLVGSGIVEGLEVYQKSSQIKTFDLTVSPGIAILKYFNSETEKIEYYAIRIDDEINFSITDKENNDLINGKGCLYLNLDLNNDEEIINLKFDYENFIDAIPITNFEIPYLRYQSPINFGSSKEIFVFLNGENATGKYYLDNETNQIVFYNQRKSYDVVSILLIEQSSVPLANIKTGMKDFGITEIDYSIRTNIKEKIIDENLELSILNHKHDGDTLDKILLTTESNLVAGNVVVENNIENYKKFSFSKTKLIENTNFNWPAYQGISTRISFNNLFDNTANFPTKTNISTVKDSDEIQNISKNDLKGFIVNPNIEQKKVYIIDKNTDTSITTSDDLTKVAKVNNNYLITSYNIEVYINKKKNYGFFKQISDDNVNIIIEFDYLLRSSDIVEIKLKLIDGFTEVKNLIELEAENKTKALQTQLQIDASKFKNTDLNTQTIPILSHKGHKNNNLIPITDRLQTYTEDNKTFYFRRNNIKPFLLMKDWTTFNNYKWVCASGTIYKAPETQTFYNFDKELNNFKWEEIFCTVKNSSKDHNFPYKFLQFNNKLYTVTSGAILEYDKNNNRFVEKIVLGNDKYYDDLGKIFNLENGKSEGISIYDAYSNDDLGILFCIEDKNSIGKLYCYNKYINDTYNISNCILLLNTQIVDLLVKSVIVDNNYIYALLSDGVYRLSNNFKFIVNNENSNINQITLNSVVGFQVNDLITISSVNGYDIYSIVSISNNVITLNKPIGFDIRSNNTLVFKTFQKVYSISNAVKIKHENNLFVVYTDKDIYVSIDGINYNKINGRPYTINDIRDVYIIDSSKILVATDVGFYFVWDVFSQTDNFDYNYVYGYGYGFGEDFFDVFGLTNIFFDIDELYGYRTGYESELLGFIAPYGYGYGVELTPLWSLIYNKNYDLTVNDKLTDANGVFYIPEENIYILSTRLQAYETANLRNGLVRCLDVQTGFNSDIDAISQKKRAEGLVGNIYGRSFDVFGNLNYANVNDYVYVSLENSSLYSGKYLRILKIVKKDNNLYQVWVDGIDGGDFDRNKLSYYDKIEVVERIQPLPLIDELPQITQYDLNYYGWNYDFATQSISFDLKLNYTRVVTVQFLYRYFYSNLIKDNYYLYLNNRNITTLSGNWNRINFVDNIIALSTGEKVSGKKIILSTDKNIFYGLNIEGITIQPNSTVAKNATVVYNTYSSIAIDGSDYETVADFINEYFPGQNSTDFNGDFSIKIYLNNENEFLFKNSLQYNEIINIDLLDTSITDVGVYTHEQIDNELYEEIDGLPYDLAGLKNSLMLQIVRELQELEPTIDINTTQVIIKRFVDNIIDFNKTVIENKIVYTQAECGPINEEIFSLYYSDIYNGLFVATKTGVWFKANQTVLNPFPMWEKQGVLIDTLSANNEPTINILNVNGFYIWYDLENKKWELRWGGRHSLEDEESTLKQNNLLQVFSTSKNKNLIYISTDKYGLYRTTDKGSTFNNVLNKKVFNYQDFDIIDIEIDNYYDNVVTALTNEGLYRSWDYGANFDLVFQLPEKNKSFARKYITYKQLNNDGNICPHTGSLYIIAKDLYILRPQDGIILNNNNYNFNFNELEYNKLLVKSSNFRISNITSTTNLSYAQKQIIKSYINEKILEDRIEKFSTETESYTVPDYDINNIVLLSTVGEGIVVLVNDGELLNNAIGDPQITSRNRSNYLPISARLNGRYSTLQLNDRDITSIAINDNNNFEWYVGTYYSGVAYTDDFGQTWSNKNNGLPTNIYGEQNLFIKKILIYNNTPYLITDGYLDNENSGVYKYDGNNWVLISENLGIGKYTDISITDERIYVTLGENGVYYTEDEINWTRIILPEYNTNVLFDDKIENIYVGTNGRGVFDSEDLGINWLQLFNSTLYNKGISSNKWRIWGIKTDDNSGTITPLVFQGKVDNSSFVNTQFNVNDATSNEQIIWNDLENEIVEKLVTAIFDANILPKYIFDYDQVKIINKAITRSRAWVSSFNICNNDRWFGIADHHVYYSPEFINRYNRINGLETVDGDAVERLGVIKSHFDINKYKGITNNIGDLNIDRYQSKLSEYDLTSITQNPSDGTLYFGTNGSGVFKVNKSIPQPFSTLIRVINNEDILVDTSPAIGDIQIQDQYLNLSDIEFSNIKSSTYNKFILYYQWVGLEAGDTKKQVFYQRDVRFIFDINDIDWDETTKKFTINSSTPKFRSLWYGVDTIDSPVINIPSSLIVDPNTDLISNTVGNIYDYIINNYPVYLSTDFEEYVPGHYTFSHYGIGAICEGINYTETTEKDEYDYFKTNIDFSSNLFNGENFDETIVHGKLCSSLDSSYFSEFGEKIFINNLLNIKSIHNDNGNYAFGVNPNYFRFSNGKTIFRIKEIINKGIPRIRRDGTNGILDNESNVLEDKKLFSKTIDPSVNLYEGLILVELNKKYPFTGISSRDFLRCRIFDENKQTIGIYRVSPIFIGIEDFPIYDNYIALVYENYNLRVEEEDFILSEQMVPTTLFSDNLYLEIYRDLSPLSFREDRKENYFVKDTLFIVTDIENYVQINNGLPELEYVDQNGNNEISLNIRDIFAPENNRIYIGTYHKGVYRYNGTNWEEINNDLDCYSINKISPVNLNDLTIQKFSTVCQLLENDLGIFAATENGVWLWCGDINSWVSLGLENIKVKDIEVPYVNSSISKHYIFAITEKDAIWYFALEDYNISDIKSGNITWLQVTEGFENDILYNKKIIQKPYIYSKISENTEYTKCKVYNTDIFEAGMHVRICGYYFSETENSFKFAYEDKIIDEISDGEILFTTALVNLYEEGVTTLINISNYIYNDYEKINENLLYSFVEEGGFFVSYDNGDTWTKRINGLPHLNIKDVIIHPKNQNYVILLLEGSNIYLTRDSGLTWEFIGKNNNGIINKLYWNYLSDELWVTLLAGENIDGFINENRIDEPGSYVSTNIENLSIYKSSDFGKTWEIVKSYSGDIKSGFTDISFSLLDQNKYCFASDEKLFIIGENSETIINKAICRVIINPDNDENFIGIDINGNVLDSVDNGNTWNIITAVDINATRNNRILDNLLLMPRFSGYENNDILVLPIDGTPIITTNYKVKATTKVIPSILEINEGNNINDNFAVYGYELDENTAKEIDNTVVDPEYFKDLLGGSTYYDENNSLHVSPNNSKMSSIYNIYPINGIINYLENLKNYYTNYIWTKKNLLIPTEGMFSSGNIYTSVIHNFSKITIPLSSTTNKIWKINNIFAGSKLRIYYKVTGISVDLHIISNHLSGSNIIFSVLGKIPAIISDPGSASEIKIIIIPKFELIVDNNNFTYTFGARHISWTRDQFQNNNLDYRYWGVTSFTPDSDNYQNNTRRGRLLLARNAYGDNKNYQLSLARFVGGYDWADEDAKINLNIGENENINNDNNKNLYSLNRNWVLKLDEKTILFTISDEISDTCGLYKLDLDENKTYYEDEVFDPNDWTNLTSSLLLEKIYLPCIAWNNGINSTGSYIQNSNYIYLYASDNEETKLYFSSDGGENWPEENRVKIILNNVEAKPDEINFIIVAPLENNYSTLYLGANNNYGHGGLWVSYNKGISWNYIDLSKNILDKEVNKVTNVYDLQFILSKDGSKYDGKNIIVSCEADGENIVFRTFADILYINTIIVIEKSNKTYYLFGTERNGIVYYDGLNYKVYNTTNGSLTNNIICSYNTTNLSNANIEDIYFGTDVGLLKIEFKENTLFSDLDKQFLFQNTINDKISNISGTTNNELIFGYKNNIILINRNNNVLINKTLNSLSVLGTVANVVKQTTDGELIIGTDNGISLVNYTISNDNFNFIKSENYNVKDIDSTADILDLYQLKKLNMAVSETTYLGEIALVNQITGPNITNRLENIVIIRKLSSAVDIYPDSSIIYKNSVFGRIIGKEIVFENNQYKTIFTVNNSLVENEHVGRSIKLSPISPVHYTIFSNSENTITINENINGVFNNTVYYIADILSNDNIVIYSGNYDLDLNNLIDPSLNYNVEYEYSIFYKQDNYYKKLISEKIKGYQNIVSYANNKEFVCRSSNNLLYTFDLISARIGNIPNNYFSVRNVNSIINNIFRNNNFGLFICSNNGVFELSNNEISRYNDIDSTYNVLSSYVTSEHIYFGTEKLGVIVDNELLNINYIDKSLDNIIYLDVLEVNKNEGFRSICTYNNIVIGYSNKKLYISSDNGYNFDTILDFNFATNKSLISINELSFNRYVQDEDIDNLVYDNNPYLIITNEQNVNIIEINDNFINGKNINIQTINEDNIDFDNFGRKWNSPSFSLNNDKINIYLNNDNSNLFKTEDINNSGTQKSFSTIKAFDINKNYDITIRNSNIIYKCDSSDFSLIGSNNGIWFANLDTAAFYNNNGDWYLYIGGFGGLWKLSVDNLDKVIYETNSNKLYTHVYQIIADISGCLNVNNAYKKLLLCQVGLSNKYNIATDSKTDKYHGYEYLLNNIDDRKQIIWGQYKNTNNNKYDLYSIYNTNPAYNYGPIMSETCMGSSDIMYWPILSKSKGLFDMLAPNWFYYGNERNGLFISNINATGSKNINHLNRSINNNPLGFHLLNYSGLGQNDYSDISNNNTTYTDFKLDLYNLDTEVELFNNLPQSINNLKAYIYKTKSYINIPGLGNSRNTNNVDYLDFLKAFRIIGIGFDSNDKDIIYASIYNPKEFSNLNNFNYLKEITYDKNISYILKSTDGGHTWGFIGDNLPTGIIRSIVVNPKNSNQIFISIFGTSSINDETSFEHGVYYSNNGGATFTKISCGLPNKPVTSLKIAKLDNRNVLYASIVDDGIYYLELENYIGGYGYGYSSDIFGTPIDFFDVFGVSGSTFGYGVNDFESIKNLYDYTYGYELIYLSSYCWNKLNTIYYQRNGYNLNNLVVNDITNDNENNIYVATNSNGLFKIDKVNKLWKQLIDNNSYGVINTVYVDKENHEVLVGSNNEIKLLDTNGIWNDITSNLDKPISINQITKYDDDKKLINDIEFKIMDRTIYNMQYLFTIADGTAITTYTVKEEVGSYIIGNYIGQTNITDTDAIEAKNNFNNLRNGYGNTIYVNNENDVYLNGYNIRIFFDVAVDLVWQIWKGDDKDNIDELIWSNSTTSVPSGYNYFSSPLVLVENSELKLENNKYYALIVRVFALGELNGINVTNINTVNDKIRNLKQEKARFEYNLYSDTHDNEKVFGETVGSAILYKDTEPEEIVVNSELSKMAILRKENNEFIDKDYPRNYLYKNFNEKQPIGQVLVAYYGDPETDSLDSSNTNIYYDIDNYYSFRDKYSEFKYGIKYYYDIVYIADRANQFIFTRIPNIIGETDNYAYNYIEDDEQIFDINRLKYHLVIPDVKFRPNSTIQDYRKGIVLSNTITRLNFINDESLNEVLTLEFVNYAILSQQQLYPKYTLTIFISTDKGFYVSDDNGNSWEDRNLGLVGEALKINWIEIDKYESDLSPLENSISIYIATNEGVYYSVNAGGLWSLLTSTLIFGKIDKIRIDEIDNNIIYLLSNNKIYRSRDKGITFDELIIEGINIINNFELYTANTNILYLLTGEDGVVKYFDSVRDEFEINIKTQYAFSEISSDNLDLGDILISTQNKINVKSNIKNDILTNEIDGLSFSLSEENKNIEFELKWNGILADINNIYLGESKINSITNPFTLRNYTTVDDPTVIYDIKVFSNNYIGVGTNKGFYISSDGKNWEKVNEFSLPNKVYSLSETSNNNILLGTSSGLWKNSTDLINNYDIIEQQGNSVRSFWEYRYEGRLTQFRGGSVGIRGLYENHNDVKIATSKYFTSSTGIRFIWGENNIVGGGYPTLGLSQDLIEKIRNEMEIFGDDTDGILRLALVRSEYEVSDTIFGFDTMPIVGQKGQPGSLIYGTSEGTTLSPAVVLPKTEVVVGVFSENNYNYTLDNPFIDTLDLITSVSMSKHPFIPYNPVTQNQDEVFSSRLSNNKLYYYGFFPFFLTKDPMAFGQYAEDITMPKFFRFYPNIYNVNIPKEENMKPSKVVTCGVSINESLFIAGTDKGIIRSVKLLDGNYYSTGVERIDDQTLSDTNINDLYVINNKIYIATRNGIYLSTDDCNTTNLIFHGEINGIKNFYKFSSDENSNLIVSTDMGIYRKSAIDDYIWEFIGFVGSYSVGIQGNRIGTTITF